jgi:uncharacterized integral membrane protein
MKSVKAVLWALISVLILVFLFQNREMLLTESTLELNLFGPLKFRSTPIPLYAAILGALLLGVIGTALYCGIGNYRLHQRLRVLQRQNDSLQEELKSLRNLPITEAEVPAGRPANAVGIEPREETNRKNSEKTNLMDG